MSGRKGAAPVGNTNAVKHGGEAVVKAIQHGQALKGHAAETQIAIRRDFEASGTNERIIELATMLHTGALLYWRAFCAAVDSGRLEPMDNFARRFGWLANSAIRGWDRVKTDKDTPDMAEIMAKHD